MPTGIHLPHMDYTGIHLSHMDYWDGLPEWKIAQVERNQDGLPVYHTFTSEAKFCDFIERELDVPITLVSTGPARQDRRNRVYA